MTRMFPFILAIIGGEPDASPRQMSAEMARLHKSYVYNCPSIKRGFYGQARSAIKLPYY